MTKGLKNSLQIFDLVKPNNVPVVVDEGEPLALSGHLVLGEEDARDVAEGPEQLLEVVVLHVLGEV